MVRRVVVSWVILTVAVGIAAAVMPNVRVDGGVLGLVSASLVLGLVGSLLGPVLHFLTAPIKWSPSACSPSWSTESFWRSRRDSATTSPSAARWAQSSLRWSSAC